MKITEFENNVQSRDDQWNEFVSSGIVMSDHRWPDQLVVQAITEEGIPSVQSIALPKDAEVLRKIAADLCEMADFLERR